MAEEQILRSESAAAPGIGDETDAVASLVALAQSLAEQQREDEQELQRQQQQQSRGEAPPTEESPQEPGQKEPRDDETPPTTDHTGQKSVDIEAEHSETTVQTRPTDPPTPPSQEPPVNAKPNKGKTPKKQKGEKAASASAVSPSTGPEKSPTPPLHSQPLPCYLGEDALLTYIRRQCKILKQALSEDCFPMSIQDLSYSYEMELFCPVKPPRRQENGTCEADPRINFYPPFAVAEQLATYHVFFQNMRVPFSCKANRTAADEVLFLTAGACIPVVPTMESFSKIFDGLGDEEVLAENALENQDSVLIELKGDNPRLAVLKRTTALSHFAFPATTLPPKVMSTVLDNLLSKRVEGKPQLDGQEPEDSYDHVVSDEELSKWLDLPVDDKLLQERRKTMTSVFLVTCPLVCMQKFFTETDFFRKLEENIHYLFKHGYVKQACEVSNVELTNLVSYLGILHENRLGQCVLHNTLQGESRRDYIRDTIYLYLIYTWQTAMGVWQQCLKDDNLKELQKILQKYKRDLWSGFDELTIAMDLRALIFPDTLVKVLQDGLPDFASQTQMQNFRSFILERSGLLPSMCNALPSDFVPITYRESPPTLWGYTYLLKLANYLMFHTDVAFDLTSPGLLSCYCRCNLCTPHRSLAVNNALLNERQTIGTFEIQGPPRADGTESTPLKLTAGLWTSAYLRKFVPEDYNPRAIEFYEDQSGKSKKPLEACVITEATILAQLQDIKKAREEFLLKKGHGVYLDPQSGERLDVDLSSSRTDTAADGAAQTRHSGPFSLKTLSSQKTKGDRRTRRALSKRESTASPSAAASNPGRQEPKKEGRLKKSATAATTAARDRLKQLVQPRRGGGAGSVSSCPSFRSACLQPSSPSTAEEAPVGPKRN